MIPSSYELDLITMQYNANASIFGCDKHTVFSNMPVPYAHGVMSSVVETDLECEFGGKYKTALNAGIFQVVWRKVIADGTFRYYDWTVKVDPDSVFFPDRLRRHLKEQFQVIPTNGVYLNNCKFGLHGPLEVLSRVAVLRWNAGMAGCESHFRRESCFGQPCPWGEDLSMDKCLWKVLKVQRVNDSALLNEMHCDSWDWKDCKSDAVAFHPFKTVAEYRQCLNTAHQRTSSTLGPVQSAARLLAD
jgi:hypothetical protein